jgi:ATP-dependent Clp protease ATP-binding subunit ClpC
MYDSFTANARQAMFIASRVANEAGHEYIGTGHILIGILRDDAAIPSRALANLGVDVLAFRSEVDQSIKSITDNESTEPLTVPPRSKRAIELALALASGMNHEFVDCEHFLLGLLQEGEGLAAQLLGKRGVTFEAADAEIAKLREAGR